jgi:pyruvate,water dikinase
VQNRDNIHSIKNDDPDNILRGVKEKFRIFLTLLDKNNHVLETMSDMEEKAQGEYLFDINYILGRLKDIRRSVVDILECMVAIGGSKYSILQDRFSEIDSVLNTVLPGKQPIVDDDFTVPFDKLNRTRTYSVGSKNAQLGEIKEVLGLPVPEGFAISAAAYIRFVDANDLQVRISKRIDSLDIKCYEDLVRVSGEIREMVMTSPVPRNLSQQILRSFRSLAKRSSTDLFSMRSSAIGEDSLFSFAGQYASYLNVRKDELIDRYREVLASKFTPQAIYYFLSHSLSESELAMSVGCVSMVDAASSGVVYTRNPVNPKDESIMINSIFGLGKYLVNGTLTPDIFRVSRVTGRVIESSIANKPVRLTMCPEGGTVEETVPREAQMSSSLNKDQIQLLADYAVKLEDHYRRPQDIEWAIDRRGQLYLLQSRPLQVFSALASEVMVDVTEMKVLLEGGTTVCPGAGSGPIYQIASAKDIPDVPAGVVLVAPHPFPGLITLMGKINALVSNVGGVASHMATIAREYRIPTLVGLEQTDKLTDGQIVTVDATGGVIYEGEQQELVNARRPTLDMFEDSSIPKVLDRVLDLVSPLRLVHPADKDFLPENCVTFHDITRYAHQKAIEEMFLCTRQIDKKDMLGFKLKTDLPIDMNIIYLDQDYSWRTRKEVLTEENIISTPLFAFWEGIKLEGWPSRPKIKGKKDAIGTNLTYKNRTDYSESGFAVLGKEYMMLNLWMGYHLATIEAMCTDEDSKNYIQMQYKEGGASLDRRIRRIKLLTEILTRLGFMPLRKSDFLHSTISYQNKEAIARKLRLMGRLVMMTKQLDMALSNDAVARWYTNDFLKRLGLDKS